MDSGGIGLRCQSWLSSLKSREPPSLENGRTSFRVPFGPSTIAYPQDYRPFVTTGRSYRTKNREPVRSLSLQGVPEVSFTFFQHQKSKAVAKRFFYET